MKFSALRIVVFGIFLGLGACATPTQPSVNLSAYPPHPAPVDNFQVVVPHEIYRSGQPISAADWAYLESVGVKTIIKLNEFSSKASAAVEIQEAKKHGIKVIPVYMQPEDFPHNLNPWARPDEAQLMRAVSELENKNNGVMLVHCSHGKDRTGLVVALYSVRNKNYCKDTAYQQMKFYGASPWLFGVKSALDRSSIQQGQSCAQQYQ